MDIHEHKDFTPCDFCRPKIKAQIFQTTPERVQKGLPMQHSKGPVQVLLCNISTPRQGGLSFLFQQVGCGQDLHIGFQHMLEGLMSPQTHCSAHWLPCKDLSSAPGLLGAFFIQLPP